MTMGGLPVAERFQWNRQRSEAALLLAEGRSSKSVASRLGVATGTIKNWRRSPEFAAEVDRLTLMSDIASRAARLRIAIRVARQKTGDDVIETDKDLLDWLKYAQGETDGIRLELAALSAASAPLADSRPDRTGTEGGERSSGR
jgi:hypothetical protein